MQIVKGQNSYPVGARGDPLSDPFFALLSSKCPGTRVDVQARLSTSVSPGDKCLTLINYYDFYNILNRDTLRSKYILREKSLAMIYNWVSHRRSLKHQIFLIGRFANISAF